MLQRTIFIIYILLSEVVKMEAFVKRVEIKPQFQAPVPSASSSPCPAPIVFAKHALCLTMVFPSRPIFNKSTRFEDMRNYEDERTPIRRPSMKKPMNKASGMQSRDDDLDFVATILMLSGQASVDSICCAIVSCLMFWRGHCRELKSGSSSSRVLTSRPEAMSLDFVVRPQSKIDPDEIRARAKQVVQDQRRLKMNKRLQQLKAPKKKQLQASKLSVEGRGMIKYL